MRTAADRFFAEGTSTTGPMRRSRPVWFLLCVEALLVVTLFPSAVRGWSGPVKPLDEGYGAEGPFQVRIDTIRGCFPVHRTVWVYRPAYADTAFPLIFFLAGFRAWHPEYYEPLLRHLASRGYCVVFPSYLMLQFPLQHRTFHLLYMGAAAGARAERAYIDTTRIGFVGHSFGASAVLPLAYRLLTRRRWGSNGAFMFLMAPFYLFACPPRTLARFPSDTKLIVQVYEDDDCNDHRMAKDLFESIVVAPPNKSFVILRSDTCPVSGYVLKADHAVPFGPGDDEGKLDGLDFYGVFRLVDALAGYAFAGDSLAGTIALGSTDSSEAFMGRWPDKSAVKTAIVTKHPPLLRPRSQFFFHWNHPWNLRRRWARVRLDDPWEK